MENKPASENGFSNSFIGKLFLGGLPVLGGLLTILVSINILPYTDLRPNRIAIFNDPHTWEVFAVGSTMLFFGIANILPPQMKALGRINTFLFFLSLMAVVIGVLLKRFGR
ncbi:MAG: hypothetical protein U0V18_08980 [Anaerolineales bacterium]